MPIWIAFIITFIAAIVWLRVNDTLATKKVISNQLSRKIIHTGTGPIFVLCWLLFPDAGSARYVAAIIPMLITIQFFLVGIGAIKDKASVDAISRTGDPREILKGPFFYGIVFVLVTILFWKDSVVGIIALMILCGGDGLADIIGRRVKSRRLPWSREKSWAGLIAMFLGGTFFSLIVSVVFFFGGQISVSIASLIFNILLINIATTLVESLPIKDYDNITVPLTAIFLGLLLF